MAKRLRRLLRRNGRGKSVGGPIGQTPRDPLIEQAGEIFRAWLSARRQLDAGVDRFLNTVGSRNWDEVAELREIESHAWQRVTSFWSTGLEYRRESWDR
jgi:hypothetical protein